MKKLYATSLFLLMLVTGVFWGTWFTLTRSLESFSTAEFIHIGKVIISNVALPMRFLLPTSMLLVLITIGIFYRNRSKLYIHGIISFTLFLVVLLITLIVLVPIDNEIKTWTVTSVPVSFEFLREKWGMWHAVRTFLSLIGFFFFGWMVIKGKEGI